jgi:hypothetical protein
MKTVLKGFKDYAEFLSYSDILFGWFTSKQHKALYNYLLSVQALVDPVTLMRHMKVKAQEKMMAKVKATAAT